MTDSLYQTPAENKAPAAAALEFAKTYWTDGPREIENATTQPDPLTGVDTYSFQVEYGTRTYKVVYQPAIPLVSIALYKIVVESPL